MQATAGERFFWCGAKPQVVIHFTRHLLGICNVTDATAPFVTQAARNLDFSEIAGLHPLYSVLYAFATTGLSAGLYDFLVFSGGIYQLPTFPYVVAYGLFNIYICARLNSPDSSEAVPMVRGSHRNNIQLFLIKHLTDILIALHLVFGSAGIQHLFVHITQCCEFHTLFTLLHAGNGANVTTAPATEAYSGAAQSFIGSLYLSPALGSPCNRSSGIEGGFKK